MTREARPREALTPKCLPGHLAAGRAFAINRRYPICANCQQEFSTEHANQKYCEKPECKRAQKRRYERASTQRKKLKRQRAARKRT